MVFQNEACLCGDSSSFVRRGQCFFTIVHRKYAYYFKDQSLEVFWANEFQCNKCPLNMLLSKNNRQWKSIHYAFLIVVSTELYWPKEHHVTFNILHRWLTFLWCSKIKSVKQHLKLKIVKCRKLSLILNALSNALSILVSIK